MFDDLDTAEQRTEESPSDDQPKSSRGLWPWAHFPALLIFSVLFVVLNGNPWRLHIAIGGAYTVLVFGLTFGASLRNADDFFGDSRVPLYVAKLLIPHALILALVILGVSEWLRLRPMLPLWVTQEGRKGSLWMLFGWLLLIGTALGQASWMAGRIKRRFGEPED
jgi:hypothetical protein